MAHTISKHIYISKEHKFVECEVLVLDEEEGLPGTDRREIILFCANDEAGIPFSEIADSGISDVDGLYPETELIDQYENFDEKTGYSCE